MTVELSSTREALVAADAVIDRVRARLGDTGVVPPDTAMALRIADHWSRCVDRLIADREREARSERRQRPSVTARLMARRASAA
jgi:hypothetical protein